MSKMIWFGIFKPSKMLTFYIIYVVSRCEHLIWQCHINWSVCMLILLGNSIINSQTASIFTLILDSLCAKLSGRKWLVCFYYFIVACHISIRFCYYVYIYCRVFQLKRYYIRKRNTLEKFTCVSLFVMRSSPLNERSWSWPSMQLLNGLVFFSLVNLKWT